MTITFYTTLGCHLCELAEAEMGRVYSSLPAINKVDIAHDETLVAAYGERIPVLKRNDSKNELAWPFSAEDILDWLAHT